MATDGMTASERRRCTLLFEHLGLTDRSKITFLSSLLHKMFETTTILDQHLAEHGASVHSAVSRMHVSENPQEPPSHRWIRVVDRLGFFTDAYDHAERIVDAIAGANAVMLGNFKVTGKKGAEDSAQLLSGCVTASYKNATTTGDPSPHRDRRKAAVPAVGVVVSVGGRVNEAAVAVIANGLGGPAAGGAAGSTTGAQSKGIGVPGGEGAGAPPCDTINGKAPIPRRGKVGSATADHPAHSNEARSLFQDGLEPEEPPPIASKIPSENIFDRQPVVDPRSTAIAVVSSVLKVAANRENGRNVLRQLLVDSLLGLARSGPRAPPMPPRSLSPTGTNRLGGDLSPTLPPLGTLAAALHPVRRAGTARWIVAVKITSLHSLLRELSIKAG
ncbi:hypothetical protein BU14_0085s0010 [Porphyra umbilicalis]|uniref:Uncharacterized protein n=1 Tax=Porphyra umbilicalis TaxID=2786 RepID=A0A1X6PE51_PORUM|nr:hypothetical protein BU14_0085s0010 [Porphyra umbilicalis]|eukprot:OSX79159.1 hypothetical protein BU14_0085s0010 [Porphyra umbilicalis]